MNLFWLFRISLLCHYASGVFIYVASDNGNITTLSLTQETFASSSPSNYVNKGYFAGSGPAKKYNLSQISTTNTTAEVPAWITLNKHNNILYLTDGTTTGNGTISSFRTSSTGDLVQLDSVECLIDGAHAEFYANGQGLAIAHYSGSALQTYSITSEGNITPLQTFTYTQNATGPDGHRQSSPHPHSSVQDPTGQYLLINDLGSDLVRVYAIEANATLSERPALQAKPGSGPRHAVFSPEPIPSSNDGAANYIYYLAAEIGGTVTAYRVTYLPSKAGLQFDELPDGNYSTLAPGVKFPAITANGGAGISAEPRISPDGNFLIVSNRRDQSFSGTETQYPFNGTSDSVVTFRIRNDLDGSLEYFQSVPAGGDVPRSWALNKAGTLAAVGLQLSEKVTILERDVDSGLFIQQVAEVDVAGELFAVVFDE